MCRLQQLHLPIFQKSFFAVGSRTCCRRKSVLSTNHSRNLPEAVVDLSFRTDNDRVSSLSAHVRTYSRVLTPPSRVRSSQLVRTRPALSSLERASVKLPVSCTVGDVMAMSWHYINLCGMCSHGWHSALVFVLANYGNNVTCTGCNGSDTRYAWARLPIECSDAQAQFSPFIRKVSATSPVQVALVIRKRKYHRLQQRHSPLSATACRLLLSMVGGADGATRVQLSGSVTDIASLREPLLSIERQLPRAMGRK